MLANNIANTSTAGFKADREYFGLYLSSEAAESPAGTTPETLPVTQHQWTDFSQGSLSPTGNQLDLALTGQGFFVARTPSGLVFTRDGSLRLSQQGELQTEDGFQIQATDGKPIVLDSTKPVAVGTDGMVRQDNQDISQISIVTFKDPAALAKRGNNYFQTETTLVTPIAATAAQIRQGQLESANAQPAESAVRLVNVMRQFETLQKALAIGSDMNRRVVEEVAKVS